MRGTRTALVALVISTLLFGAIAATVLFWPAVDELDVRFVRWVHLHAPEVLVDAARVVTHVGGIAVLGPLALVSAMVLARLGRPSEGIFVVVATAVGQLVNLALKTVFARARPEFDDPYVQLASYAFPSGHAFGAATTYGALALVVAAATSRRILPFLLAAALVSLVAATRVVLGVHFALDVIAGAVGGIAVLVALRLLFELQETPIHARSARCVGRNEQPQRPGLDRGP